MGRHNYIRKRDPLTEIAKAKAEELRIRQVRQRGIEQGTLGRTPNERREALQELRKRQHQARADKREAMERMFGELGIRHDD